MPELAMRDIRDEDFDFIYEIYSDPGVNRAMNYPAGQKEDFQRIFSELKGRTYFWCFEHKDLGAVGMASFVAGFGRMVHSGMIGTVNVHPDYQGRGFGKAQMYLIIDFLKDKGYTRLHLNALADNVAAIGLYRSLGFHEDGFMPAFWHREYEDKPIGAYLFSLTF